MADEKQEAMKGAPGEESPAGGQGKQGPQQSTPGQGAGERVKVQVGDREIEVDESVALILESQQRGFEEYQQRMAQQMRQLEQRGGAPADKKSDVPDFYDDPNAWMAHHMGEFRGYVDQALTKTTKQQREREFWDEFYGDFDDLKGAERLVNSVFAENLDRLADLPVARAKTEIARLARAERDKLVRPYLNQPPEDGKEQGGGEQRSLRQIVTRPGGGGERKSGGGADDERPQTLGGVLKARRTRRYQRRGAQE